MEQNIINIQDQYLINLPEKIIIKIPKPCCSWELIFCFLPFSLSKIKTILTLTGKPCGMGMPRFLPATLVVRETTGPQFPGTVLARVCGRCMINNQYPPHCPLRVVGTLDLCPTCSTHGDHCGFGHSASGSYSKNQSSLQIESGMRSMGIHRDCSMKKHKYLSR